MKLSLISAGALFVGLFATGCSFMSSDPGKALGLGGAPTCESVACGASGSMKICTSTSAEGACSGISYEVGGKTFSCGSCTDCEQAATQASQVCETGAAGDADGGFLSPGDAGSSGGPGGGSTTCAAAVACGTSGTTYQECVTTGAGGVCSSITMKTSDGRSFACSGCECTQAAEELASYCGDGSGGGGVDSGTGGSSGTTCSGQVPCGSDGSTYQECTTVQNGACSQVTYQTSDGQSFSCTGCSDCSSAVTQLESYCGEETSDAGSGGTTCGSAVTCGSNGTTYQACTTTDGTGACTQIVYETSDGQSFSCNGCSDCSSAAQELSSYCSGSGSSSGGQQCGSVTCGSAAACCTCSGQPICYSLPPGSTCADIGSGCS